MIFEQHVNGPDNPGAIQYKDKAGIWQTLPIPEIVWAFQSEQKQNEPVKDEPGTDYTEGDVHTLYIVTQDRKVYSFAMAEEEIEEFYQALQQANPKVIIEALRSHRLPMEMLQNCRDLGGLQSQDGRFIIPHKLLRSDALHPANKHDKEILEKEYHLKTVVDFRTDWERVMEPDPFWFGVKHIHIPVFHESQIDIEKDGSSPKAILKMLENPRELLTGLYQDMAVNEMALKAWNKFFQVLLSQPEGSILFHCTQGKDRTGLAAALICFVLGIDEETILKDYELTTIYLTAHMDDVMKDLVDLTGKTPQELANLKYLYEALPEYIDTFLKTAKEKYGSMDNYIRQGIGLSEAQIQKLKDAYLTQPVQE